MTLNDLKNRANQIFAQTKIGANTHSIVGGLLSDIIDFFLPSSAVSQTTGSDSTKVMSQKAVSNLIASVNEIIDENNNVQVLDQIVILGGGVDRPATRRQCTVRNLRKELRYGNYREIYKGNAFDDASWSLDENWEQLTDKDYVDALSKKGFIYIGQATTSTVPATYGANDRVYYQFDAPVGSTTLSNFGNLVISGVTIPSRYSIKWDGSIWSAVTYDTLLKSALGVSGGVAKQDDLVQLGADLNGIVWNIGYYDAINHSINALDENFRYSSKMYINNNIDIIIKGACTDNSIVPAVSFFDKNDKELAVFGYNDNSEILTIHKNTLPFNYSYFIVSKHASSECIIKHSSINSTIGAFNNYLEESQQRKLIPGYYYNGTFYSDSNFLRTQYGIINKDANIILSGALTDHQALSPIVFFDKDYKPNYYYKNNTNESTVYISKAEIPSDSFYYIVNLKSGSYISFSNGSLYDIIYNNDINTNFKTFNWISEWQSSNNDVIKYTSDTNFKRCVLPVNKFDDIIVKGACTNNSVVSALILLANDGMTILDKYGLNTLEDIITIDKSNIPIGCEYISICCLSNSSVEYSNGRYYSIVDIIESNKYNATNENSLAMPKYLYLFSNRDNFLFNKNISKKNLEKYGVTIYHQSQSRVLKNSIKISNPVNGSKLISAIIDNDSEYFNFIDKKETIVRSADSLTGSSNITIGIIGDSWVQNAEFYKYALITNQLCPNVKLIGIMEHEYNDNLFVEGHGGWALSDYFSNSYGAWCGTSPFWHPNTGRFWGHSEFWVNIPDLRFKKVRDAYYNQTTGYPLLPILGDVIYDVNYKLYNGSTWDEITYNSSEWSFSYPKYFEMYSSILGVIPPDILFIELGLNDVMLNTGMGSSLSIRSNFYNLINDWKSKILLLLASYKSLNQNGKLVIMIPTSVLGSNDNDFIFAGIGDNYIKQALNNTDLGHRLMWEWRNLLIENFDNRENEGIYLLDSGILVDNDYGSPYTEELPFEAYDGVDRVKVFNNTEHPYYAVRNFGLALAAFIQYHR